MDDLGARLKRAREKRGFSLGEIANRTKISSTTLEALERGDLRRVPGGIFGRSFVRSYAAELGLDADAAVEDFVAQLERKAREAAARSTVRPEITKDDRQFLARQQRALLLLRLGIIVIAIASVGLLVWQLRAFFQRPGSELVTETAAPAPVPAMTGPMSGDVPPVQPELPEVPPDPVPDVPPPVEPVGDPAAASQAPPAAAAVRGGLVVELGFAEDAWVVVDVDGRRMVTQLFRRGDRQRFDAAREVVLDVANAGAVTWTINGQTARSLGPAGAHVRARVTPETAGEFLD